MLQTDSLFRIWQGVFLTARAQIGLFCTFTGAWPLVHLQTLSNILHDNAEDGAREQGSERLAMLQTASLLRIWQRVCLTARAQVRLYRRLIGACPLFQLQTLSIIRKMLLRVDT